MDIPVVVAADPQDVEREARFGTLNERGFVRGETAQHQWYLLVTEACAASRVPVDETVRDYLAVMLNRFTGRAELLEQLASFDFYQHVFGTARIDSSCAQDIADISLQYVAFFPERSRDRHQPRSLEYVANVGTSLYQELAKSSEGKDDWFSHAFRSMATSFGRAVMVLRSTCPRFALRQGHVPEGPWKDAARFLSLSEVTKLAPALEKFNLMYFTDPHGKNN